ncbi:MAG: hypothetical protein SFZ23_14325 [Planctomycetota bacterium]|nr:hypothetical protein [Planctomycetota bacterium]
MTRRTDRRRGTWCLSALLGAAGLALASVQPDSTSPTTSPSTSPADPAPTEPAADPASAPPERPRHPTASPLVLRAGQTAAEALASLRTRYRAAAVHERVKFSIVRGNEADGERRSASSPEAAAALVLRADAAAGALRLEMNNLLVMVEGPSLVAVHRQGSTHAFRAELDAPPTPRTLAQFMSPLALPQLSLCFADAPASEATLDLSPALGPVTFTTVGPRRMGDVSIVGESAHGTATLRVDSRTGRLRSASFSLSPSDSGAPRTLVLQVEPAEELDRRSWMLDVTQRPGVASIGQLHATWSAGGVGERLGTIALRTLEGEIWSIERALLESREREGLRHPRAPLAMVLLAYRPERGLAGAAAAFAAESLDEVHQRLRRREMVEGELTPVCVAYAVALVGDRAVDQPAQDALFRTWQAPTGLTSRDDWPRVLTSSDTSGLGSHPDVRRAEAAALVISQDGVLREVIELGGRLLDDTLVDDLERAIDAAGRAGQRERQDDPETTRPDGNGPEPNQVQPNKPEPAKPEPSSADRDDR